MYTSTQDFTLSCASGSTGPTVTRTATAISIISQQDAYAKAFGEARALAVEYLECALIPGPPVTIYYSVSKTASANNQAGYVTQTFTVTLAIGAIYSTVSQADADSAAQNAAQVQANHARDVGQKPIYYNDQQSATGSCGANFVPYTATITVTAATFSSTTSKAAANAAALANAQSQLATALSSSCVPQYKSIAVTASAACSSGTVGTPTTVSLPAGHTVASSSQSAVNSSAMSDATAAAQALLTCASGSWNVSQSFTATCTGTYGPNWKGANKTVTVSASTYFGASLSDANSKALSAAHSQANATIVCTWGGGLEP